jgi:hypothetical protein
LQIDKAVAILGVDSGVSSTGAGADTIGVVRGAEVGIEVGAEVGMATAGEIGRAGSTVRVFGRFEVRVRSSGKS